MELSAGYSVPSGRVELRACKAGSSVFLTCVYCRADILQLSASQLPFDRQSCMNVLLPG
jgi:hypothetical protein